MEIKFEEEPYEDEDWLLMLLSELIFDLLKLEKPSISLINAESVQEDNQSQLSTDDEPPNLRDLLIRNTPIDSRFPLID